MTRLVLLPIYVFFLIVLMLDPVQAQQQRYACPQINPDVRQKAVSRMMGFAREGRITGCRIRENAPLDIDCGLVMQFKVETSTFSFNMPWAGLVSCFPELSPVQSINAQAIARNEELKKQEAKNAEKYRQEQQAKENEPKHLLTRTYYDYIVVRKCFEQRQGYLSVNISEQEMDRAKKAAKAIEDGIQKSSPTAKDAAWTAATSGSDDWMTDGDKTDLALLNYNDRLQFDQSDRNRCQKTLGALEERFRKIVPEANAVKKDF